MALQRRFGVHTPGHGRGNGWLGHHVAATEDQHGVSSTLHSASNLVRCFYLPLIRQATIYEMSKACVYFDRKLPLTKTTRTSSWKDNLIHHCFYGLPVVVPLLLKGDLQFHLFNVPAPHPRSLSGITSTEKSHLRTTSILKNLLVHMGFEPFKG